MNELFNGGQQSFQGTQSLQGARYFVANVFSYMFLALIISASFAWWFGTSDLFYSLVKPEGGMTITGWVVMLAPLAFIFGLNFGLQRLSFPTLLILFLAFASIMGISLSYIFRVYDLGYVAAIFGMSALTFGVMAVVGYTTKTDLTKFGSIMIMGLVGIIIASIVNIFLESSMMHFIISVIGVLVFVGLTAYDTQKIKNMGMQVGYGTEMASKLAILGATSLYLDFINLFLFMLRAFSSRD